jgi:uncharacterized protein
VREDPFSDLGNPTLKLGPIGKSMTFKFADLENLLVCPASRSKLVQHDSSLVCVDPDCRLRYAIRDDIPILLVDEATKLRADDWGEVMAVHARDRKTGHLLGE